MSMTNCRTCEVATAGHCYAHCQINDCEEHGPLSGREGPGSWPGSMSRKCTGCFSYIGRRVPDGDPIKVKFLHAAMKKILSEGNRVPPLTTECRRAMGYLFDVAFSPDPDEVEADDGVRCCCKKLSIPDDPDTKNFVGFLDHFAMHKHPDSAETLKALDVIYKFICDFTGEKLKAKRTCERCRAAVPGHCYRHCPSDAYMNRCEFHTERFIGLRWSWGSGERRRSKIACLGCAEYCGPHAVEDPCDNYKVRQLYLTVRDIVRDGILPCDIPNCTEIFRDLNDLSVERCPFFDRKGKVLNRDFPGPGVGCDQCGGKLFWLPREPEVLEFVEMLEQIMFTGHVECPATYELLDALFERLGSLVLAKQTKSTQTEDPVLPA